jgi:hypothetical protein
MKIPRAQTTIEHTKDAVPRTIFAMYHFLLNGKLLSAVGGG